MTVRQRNTKLFTNPVQEQFETKTGNKKKLSMKSVKCEIGWLRLLIPHILISQGWGKNIEIQNTKYTNTKFHTLYSYLSGLGRERPWRQLHFWSRCCLKIPQQTRS